VFWTPHPWVAFRAEYSFEHLKNELRSNQPKKVDTHRVPLGMNVFHPSGLSGSLTGTYHNQDGKFFSFGVPGPDRSGKDDFWTVDAAINYRLPNRYGFLTFGAANLLDKKFKYFDTDRGAVNINPRVIPDRLFFSRLTLALP
jgi:hypothetical protein